MKKINCYILFFLVPIFMFGQKNTIVKLTQNSIRNHAIYYVKHKKPFTGNLFIDVSDIIDSLYFDKEVNRFMLMKKTFNANFKNGFLEGQIEIIHKQDSLKIYANFKESKLHGIFYMLKNDIVILTGSYIEGKKDGYFTKKYIRDNIKYADDDNLSIINITQYKKDTLNGFKIQTTIGNPNLFERSSIIQYVDGKKYGFNYSFFGNRNKIKNASEIFYTQGNGKENNVLGFEYGEYYFFPYDNAKKLDIIKNSSTYNSIMRISLSDYLKLTCNKRTSNIKSEVKHFGFGDEELHTNDKGDCPEDNAKYRLSF